MHSANIFTPRRDNNPTRSDSSPTSTSPGLDDRPSHALRSTSSPICSENEQGAQISTVAIRCNRNTSPAEFFGEGKHGNVLRNAISRPGTPESLLGVRVSSNIAHTVDLLFAGMQLPHINDQLLQLISYINGHLPMRKRSYFDEFIISLDDYTTVEEQYSIMRKRYITYMQNVIFTMTEQEKTKVKQSLDLSIFQQQRFHRFLPLNAVHATQLKKGDVVYRPAPLKSSTDYSTMYNMLKTKIQVDRRSDFLKGKISDCPFGSISFNWAKSINKECKVTGRDSWYILVYPANSSDIGNFHITLYDQESTAVSTRSSHATFEQSVHKGTPIEEEVAFYTQLQESVKDHVWKIIKKPGYTEASPCSRDLKHLATDHAVLHKIRLYSAQIESPIYGEHINCILGPLNQNKYAYNYARRIPSLLKLENKRAPLLTDIKAKVEPLITYTPDETALLNELASYLSLIENHIRNIQQNTIDDRLIKTIKDNRHFSCVYQDTYDKYPKTKTLAWRMFLKSIFPLGNLVCFKRTDPTDGSEVVYSSIHEIRANPEALAIYNQMSGILDDTIQQIEQGRQQELTVPVVFPPIQKPR